MAARPTSTTKPICARMSIGMPRNSRPLTEASRHIGTISTTASGSFQLSYLRRQHQEDEQRRGAEHQHRRRALLLLLEGDLGPFEADAGRQHLLRQLLHPVQRGAGGDARRGDALHLGGRDTGCSAARGTGSSSSFSCATVPIGTISPGALRAFSRVRSCRSRRNRPSACTITW